MDCSCKCNETILTSTATVAVSDTLLLITPDTALSPANEGRVKIKITNSVPAAGAALPVAIVLNGGNVFVFDKFGNSVYGTELFEGMILRGYYGNNGYSATGHYQLIKLPKKNNCGGCNGV